MIFTATMVYQINRVGLSPLQLVLVGTTLEIAILIFEVPTGVVADAFSRRLSIVIGYFLIGVGFILEGSLPIFSAILFAQLLWGCGYTFTSGATQAWISDEIGEAAAGHAFLRGNQIGNVAALGGILLGTFLGAIAINFPIILGGIGSIALAILLISFMPETGFKAVPRQDRETWQHLAGTFRDGLAMVKRRPALKSILAIGLLYGLFSEGFDRLWTMHILKDMSLPFDGIIEPVVWIGLMRGIGLLLSVVATELIQRRVDTGSHFEVARVLMLITIALISGLFAFALAGVFIIAILAYWVIYVTRNVTAPVYTAWVNQKLDSQVRATVLSISSQMDAVGQILGGPGVGMIGNAISVRAALLTSASVLSPVLAIYSRLIHKADLLEEEI